MGKAALEGRPGVARVSSGWRGYREVNTVRYDPDILSIEDMVWILKKSGTYRGTIGQP